MLTRCLALALATCVTLSAAPKRKVPMIQATLEAGVTFGPGREPLPGTPPFQPKLECNLTFAAPPPKALKVRLWLVPVASAPAKAPSTVKGARPLVHEMVSLDGGVQACRADWPQGLQAGEWRAAVEFIEGGRGRGFVQAPIRVRYLPATHPGGGRVQDN